MRRRQQPQIKHRRQIKNPVSISDMRDAVVDKGRGIQPLKTLHSKRIMDSKPKPDNSLLHYLDMSTAYLNPISILLPDN